MPNVLNDEQWTNLLVSLRSGSPAATVKDVLYIINGQLIEARAQGAAEERERLAKDADARGRHGREGAWHNFAHWLRSNTGEG